MLLDIKRWGIRSGNFSKRYYSLMVCGEFHFGKLVTDNLIGIEIGNTQQPCLQLLRQEKLQTNQSFSF